MAPRRSQQSAWGVSSTGPSTRLIVLGAVVLLALGATIGWFVRGSDSGVAGNSVKTKTVKDGSIIDPASTGIVAGDKTENGAVTAATSYIIGFPSVALQTPSDRDRALGAIVAPDAKPEVSQQLQVSLTDIRAQLVGPIGAEQAPQARFVMSPLTHKVEVKGPDEAHVILWYVTVFLDPNGSKAESTWSTAEFTLKWTDHWRIVDYGGRLGPTPPLYSRNAQVSPYAEVAQVFSGFRSYRSAVIG